MSLSLIIILGTVSICAIYFMWQLLTLTGMMVPPPDEDWYWKETDQE